MHFCIRFLFHAHLMNFILLYSYTSKKLSINYICIIRITKLFRFHYIIHYNFHKVNKYKLKISSCFRTLVRKFLHAWMENTVFKIVEQSHNTHTHKTYTPNVKTFLSGTAEKRRTEQSQSKKIHLGSGAFQRLDNSIIWYLESDVFRPSF